MYIDDLLRAGNAILDDVVQAVSTNEYTDLGQKIRSRVREVTEEAAGKYTGEAARKTARETEFAFDSTRKNAYRSNLQQTVRPDNVMYRKNTGTGSYFLRRRIGKTGPTLGTVFGALGMLFFGIPGIISLAGTIVNGNAAALAGLIIFGILTAGSGVVLRKGLRESRLIDRYYAYGRQLGGAEYVSIPAFAVQIGKTEQEVRGDLLDMMDKGYLPQARMDAQQKTLILTDRAYALYRQAEESRRQRDAEETERRKKEEKEQKKQQAEPQQTQEIREILARGNAYIKKVRDVNDVIPDTEEMSTKLYRLEEIMHRIFEQVKKQPASASGLRRFMDYYLPTTEKLLDAYVELERLPVGGGNITKTKQEIDEAMDVINDAFENLLNSMFETMAWDISSDISVMKTMLAQDGLTEKELLPR